MRDSKARKLRKLIGYELNHKEQQYKDIDTYKIIWTGKERHQFVRVKRGKMRICTGLRQDYLQLKEKKI